MQNEIKFNIENKSNLKKVLYALSNKFDEVIVEVDGNEISIRVIDKCHISCIYLTTEYPFVYDKLINTKYIVSLKELYDAVKDNYSKLDSIELKQDTRYSFTYVNDILVSKISYEFLEDLKCPPKPYIEYPVEFIPNNLEKLRIATKFLTSNKKLSDDMGRIIIDYYTSDRVEYSWDNEDLDFKIKDGAYRMNKYDDFVEPYRSLYDGFELNNILKLPIKDAYLCIGTDMPITIKGTFDSGLSCLVEFEYLLAPRIEEDR